MTTDDVVARYDPAHQDAVRAVLDRNEHLTDYFSIVTPQPLLTELPTELSRKCCQYKSCGNTDIYLATDSRYVHVEADLHRKVDAYEYRRKSNDDVFFHGSKDDLLAQLNDPEWFPVDEDGYDRLP